MKKFKQARVNGGSNYDSLKVAKCLVIELIFFSFLFFFFKKIKIKIEKKKELVFFLDISHSQEKITKFR